MSKTAGLGDDLHDYLVAVSAREPDILVRLREETSSMQWSTMQISPDQGALLQMLVRLAGIRRHLEIGVYTGYSSLAVALALPGDGRITACDINEAWTAIAMRYWRQAGMAERIDLRLGPAVETLDGLLAEGAGDSYDSAFIDADKVGYDGYFERCMKLVRPGGLIMIDNVLWSGRVIDPGDDSADTLAIRALNAKLRDDDRIDLCMLPIADGLTLARRRP